MTTSQHHIEYRDFAVEVRPTTNERGSQMIRATASKRSEPHERTELRQQAYPGLWSQLSVGLISPDIESMAITATERIQQEIDRWYEKRERIDSAIESGVASARGKDDQGGRRING